MSQNSRIMVSAQVPRVLIAGCGITSSVIASRLCNAQAEYARKVDVSIWDKAKGAGGRMATSRSSTIDSSSVDLGCQYVSCSPSAWKEHAHYYTELMGAGVLEPFTSLIYNFKNTYPDTKHFVAPAGMSSVVKFFLNKSGCKPQFSHHISSIEKFQGKWNVSTMDGKCESFDVVILTMPVPQVMQLKGDIQGILDNNSELKQKLQQVEYSSRYALGLFYEKNTELKLPADVGYVNDHSVFRYFAVDNRRRNRPLLPTSLVLHTTVQFGELHKEKLPKEVEPILMDAAKELFPELPQPSEIKPQKWKFSQVVKAFDGSPGFVSLSENLLIGGDGFTQSNFEGCVTSAEKITNLLSNL